MPRFRVVGTLKKMYSVDVDEVVDAANETEACERVTEEVIQAQSFNHDGASYEWFDCGPNVFEADDV